jgi:acyl-CoA hydrolase
MAWVDEASAMAVRALIPVGGACLTVRTDMLDAVLFHKPGHVGDRVSLHAQANRVFDDGVSQ